MWVFQMRIHPKARPGQFRYLSPKSLMGLGRLSLCLLDLSTKLLGHPAGFLGCRKELERQAGPRLETQAWRPHSDSVHSHPANIKKRERHGVVCTGSEVPTTPTALAWQNSLKNKRDCVSKPCALLCSAGVSHPPLHTASCYITAQSISTTACAVLGSL